MNSNTINLEDQKISVNGSLTGKVKILISDNTTDANNSGAGETDLMTYTLPANSLEVQGDFIEVCAILNMSSSLNNKIIKAYFDGTAVYTSETVAGIGPMFIRFRVYRHTTASSQKIEGFVLASSTLYGDKAFYATSAGDLTTALVVKITGQGGASNEITQKTMTVEISKAP